MVKHTNTHAGDGLKPVKQRDISPAKEPHISEPPRSKENILNEDVIVSLADAYENKRARQVNEWERRQFVARAS
jgi:hypothetical protein